MAQAYFCNCLGEPLGFSLNAIKDNENTVEIAPAQPNFDALQNCLPMIGVEMAANLGPQFQVFSTTSINVLFVATAGGHVNEYDLSITPDLADEDLIFFLFGHTIAGHAASGVMKGVSIDIHERIRKIVQDGTTLPGIIKFGDK